MYLVVVSFPIRLGVEEENCGDEKNLLFCFPLVLFERIFLFSILSKALSLLFSVLVVVYPPVKEKDFLFTENDRLFSGSVDDVTLPRALENTEIDRRRGSLSFIAVAI